MNKSSSTRSANTCRFESQIWFSAMVFNWSVNNISRTFGVPCAVAKHIQDSGWRRQRDAESIAAASHALRSQVGV